MAYRLIVHCDISCKLCYKKYSQRFNTGNDKGSLFHKGIYGLAFICLFYFYSVGQLINGFIGDMVHPKYMIIMGLGVSSISTFAIPLFDNRIIHFAAFALIGFGLSMLRGPLMKVISENTAATHARMICTLFSMAGFAGPLIASLLSIFFEWRAVFTVTGIISVFITVASVTVISLLEKRGEIKFTPKKEKGVLNSILSVFKLEDFFFYMFISAIGEIAGSSITFWIPTYTTEHLGFSGDAASTIYSVVSLTTLFTPFITLVIYEMLIRNGVKLAVVMYVLSAVFFIAVRFTAAPLVNVIMLIIAKMAAAAASSIVWSAYIPGLARSGKVSSANGVIDAAGYAMASLANVIFSGSVSRLGWGGIVNMWYIIMLIGAAASAGKLLLRKKQS